MKDENHVIKNMQKEDKLVKRHKKKMRNRFKFGVLMFKEIKERLKSFRVRNITFLLHPFKRKKENV